jgi:uncharacterized radical SAM superfamily protein
MENAENASDMLKAVDRLISSGAEGLLVSGGCDMNGSVPVTRATDVIGYATRNGLKVNVHAGFISKGDAERLVAAGVREFSADVHQDPGIIRNILHLGVAPDAYSEMLDNIIAAGGEPIAHLTVGFGTDDLLASAELVRSKGLKEVILLALVPTKGTATEDSLIPEDAVLDAAKLLIGMGFDVTLGCMRPRPHRGLEIKCIELGIRKIANPSRGTISWAKDKGMEIIEKRTCCCIRDR